MERRGGRTRGGAEAREADATFPLRKPPGRSAVRTQHAWAGGCSMVRGRGKGTLRPVPRSLLPSVWIFGGSTGLSLRTSVRACVLRSRMHAGICG